MSTSTAFQWLRRPRVVRLDVDTRGVWVRVVREWGVPRGYYAVSPSSLSRARRAAKLGLTA